MVDSKIFIANLSSRTTENDLRDYFSKYGKIVNVTIKKKKDQFGFVEFADIRNAEEALQENDKEFLGRQIRVELANKNKKYEKRDYGDRPRRYSRDYDKRDSVNRRYSRDRRSRSFDRYKRDRRSRSRSYDRRDNRDYRDRRRDYRDNRYREKYVNDGKCFNCLSSSHLKKDCPEPPGSRSKFLNKQSRSRSQERRYLKIFNRYDDKRDRKSSINGNDRFDSDRRSRS